MAAPINQNSLFAQYLANSRNQSLTYYISFLRAKDLPFLIEDELVERVRAGVLLDALVEGLARNQLDNMSSFLQETARQLLGAGYSFEQIKLRYDFLEKSIEKTLAPWNNPEQSKYVIERSIKSIFQLANVIAVNEYMSRFNSSFENHRVSRPPSKDGNLRPGIKAGLDGVSSEQSRLPEPASVRSSYRSSSPPTDPTIPIGYLEWPLKLVPNSRPPEYYAYLEGGKPLQALLVDAAEAYVKSGKINGNLLSCRIRQVGPLVLAYPI